jgi:hypothetical protein
MDEQPPLRDGLLRKLHEIAGQLEMAEPGSAYHHQLAAAAERLLTALDQHIATARVAGRNASPSPSTSSAIR